MQTQLVDRIETAIDAGSFEEAKQLLQREQRHAASFCSVLHEWVEVTLAYIATTWGNRAEQACRVFSTAA